MHVRSYVLTCIVSVSRVQYSMTHVYITPKEFENGCFTLKTHRMFSVHTAPEEFENTAITGHFGVVFEEISARETT